MPGVEAIFSSGAEPGVMTSVEMAGVVTVVALRGTEVSGSDDAGTSRGVEGVRGKLSCRTLAAGDVEKQLLLAGRREPRVKHNLQ